jgi:hypothetical protein
MAVVFFAMVAWMVVLFWLRLIHESDDWQRLLIIDLGEMVDDSLTATAHH